MKNKNYLIKIPDIVVINKSFGNRHPFSAVAARKEIAQVFANGIMKINLIFIWRNKK
ncbi:MAG: hypothetical protein ISR66_11860 [Desulfobacula sp.]|nr:hypothetical protein [Desulfobacula sp.]